jgi:hypothetical protein
MLTTTKSDIIPKLPTEIIDKIVLYTEDARIAHILKDKISQYALNRIEKNVLIYGNVQGGKTNEIIKYIKEHELDTKVLVIQNSLLVLKQYEQRFKSQNVDYQIIGKNTKEITKKLVLILNNKYRYSYFEKVEPLKYILMMDESDQTRLSCRLKQHKNVYKTIHITATPFNNTLYDRCIKVKDNANYYGINDLNVNINNSEKDESEYVKKFAETETGIMLINKYSYVEQMTNCAKKLSDEFVNIPIVLLTSDKILYLHKKKKFIKEKSISKIIDSLKEYPHIIFIANRLSNRGLSYVSNDYSRHLTWQITKVRPNVTSFLQSLRILGIYNSKKKINLQLVFDECEEKLFEKHCKYINDFDVEKKMVPLTKTSLDGKVYNKKKLIIN